MHWRLAFIVISLIIGTLVTVTFAYLGWTRRRGTGASSFIFLMIATSIWSFSYALEQFTPELGEKIFWHKMAYLGIPYVPLFWFIFNAQILRIPFASRARWLACLAVIPVAMTLLTWTLELHPYLWGELSLGYHGPLHYLVLSRAPDFFIFVVYSYGLLAAGTMLFLKVIHQSSSLEISAIAPLAAAVAIPLFFNVLRIVFAIDPFFPYDLTPLGLTTTGVMAGWLVFRFGPLDVLAVARLALLENMNDGCIVLSSTGTVVTMNSSAQQMMLTTEEKASGERISELLPREYRYVDTETGHTLDLLFDKWGTTLDKGGTLQQEHLEVTVVDCQGKADDAYLDVSVCPLLDQRSRHQGTLLLLRDITQRKRTQQALTHAQRLESTGLLAGGVAHDFNNLLASIKMRHRLAMNSLTDERAELAHELYEASVNQYDGHAEQLLPTSTGPHPALRHLEIADTAVERAADLTRQLLAYTGKGHFKIEPIDLNQLVEENRALMATAISTKIELQIDLSPSPLYVEADRGQLQQVVMNLLLNAIEATKHEDGLVKIQTRLRTIDESDGQTYLWRERTLPGLYVDLSVTDLGIGMTPEVQSRIFDPFFTTKQNGRGLGLSALLGAIHLYNGGIQVISKPGRGTTFSAILPYTQERPTVADESLLHRNSSQSSTLGTILIADDEEPILEVLREILMDCGYTVFTASNGKSAVELFHVYGNQIDLALLDAKMPIMDGIEALKLIRKSAPKLSALLSSGYSEHEISQAVNWNRYTDFIQKPYDPDDLLRKIEHMLVTNRSRVV